MAYAPVSQPIGPEATVWPIELYEPIEPYKPIGVGNQLYLFHCFLVSLLHVYIDLLSAFIEEASNCSLYLSIHLYTKWPPVSHFIPLVISKSLYNTTTFFLHNYFLCGLLHISHLLAFSISKFEGMMQGSQLLQKLLHFRCQTSVNFIIGFSNKHTKFPFSK